MKDPKHHLDNQLEQSTFNIGDFLGQGFDLWKRGAGSYIGFTLCLIVIVIILSLIPLIGQLASSFLVAPALVIGGYLYSHKLYEGQRAEFGDFFNGFEFAAPIIVSKLITTVIGLAFMIPFIIYIVTSIGMGIFTESLENMDPDSISTLFTPGLFLGFGLFALIAIYLGLLVTYIMHFIAFYRLEGWDAIVYSVKYVHRHWFSVFAFMIIIGFLVLLGVLAIFVGMLVTISFIFPMSYISFRELTDLEGYLHDDQHQSEVIDSLIV